MVAFLVVAVLGCAQRPTAPPPGDAARPDVVLVSIDTLRADHLSAYGYSRPTSPFLDRLAAQGVRFSHARSPAPWTLPAHTTLLSGLRTTHHQVVEDTLRLAADTPVLPELFQRAGYATGGFVATMYVSRVFGFERGFDHFEDFDLHDEKRNLSGEVTAPDVLGAARGWLASLPQGKPAFLFIHLYDVHYTYDPPAPFDARFDRSPTREDPRYRNYAWYRKHPLSQEQMAHQIAQYDEAIAYVDHQLEQLWTWSASRPARWVVTADHGEELGERGSWGHAHTLYAEQLRVPLIVSGAGLSTGVVAQPVGLEDVAPTLAAWAGQPLTADGLDLGPALSGALLPDRAFVADTSRFSTNRVSILEGGLRLEWDLSEDRRELFDVGADPAERQDLSAQRPEAVDALVASLGAALGSPWEARVAGEVLTDGAALTDRARRTLKVEAGDRFAVMPADAEVRLRDSSGTSAPWRAIGGARPAEGDGLLLRGAGAAGQVELSEAQREALEALGYVQGEEHPATPTQK